jgi:hypothetical protein
LEPYSTAELSQFPNEFIDGSREPNQVQTCLLPHSILDQAGRSVIWEKTQLRITKSRTSRGNGHVPPQACRCSGRKQPPDIQETEILPSQVRRGVGSRWTTWFSAARWLQRAPETRNVLVVGAGGLGRRVVTHLENHPEAARKVCGFLDDRRPLRDGVIGRISSLAFLARRKFVEEVILAEPHNREINLRVLGEARRLGLAVRLVPDLFGCEPSQEVGERIGGVPMICLHEGRWPAANSTLKRWLDGAGAALALVAIAPPAHDDRGTHQAGLNRPGVLCG